jgi:hypothetical protein
MSPFVDTSKPLLLACHACSRARVVELRKQTMQTNSSSRPLRPEPAVLTMASTGWAGFSVFVSVVVSRFCFFSCEMNECCWLEFTLHSRSCCYTVHQIYNNGNGNDAQTIICVAL